MFDSNRQIEVQKFCEFCGTLIKSPYYTVLFSVTHLIDGSHPLISNIDRINQIVKLENGSVYDYSFETKPMIFAAANLSSEHLLCSVKCEDNFIAKYQSFYLEGKHPVYDYKKMNIFSPIAISPDHINGEERKCDYCGNNYKYYGRNWMKVPLLNTIKASGVYNIKPSLDPHNFNIILSGLSEKSPNGDWYGYNTDNSKTKASSFCSYDCAYEIVKSESVIIIVTSVMDKNRLGAIVKETELFNNLLRNPIHRPSFFQPIPL